jgi:hypothetical protein
MGLEFVAEVPKREQRFHPKPGAERAPRTESFWTLRQESRLGRWKNSFGRFEARNRDFRIAPPAFAELRRCKSACRRMMVAR